MCNSYLKFKIMQKKNKISIKHETDPLDEITHRQMSVIGHILLCFCHQALYNGMTALHNV